MQSKASEIASLLLKIKAVFLSPDKPFTWASGIKSPIYCDNRLILTAPEVRNVVEQAIADTVREKYPEALREAGADVLGVVSIFTYGMQKGIDRLKAANVKNTSLSNFDTLVSVAAEQGYISADDEPRLRRFMANPSDESWIKN